MQALLKKIVLPILLFSTSFGSLKAQVKFTAVVTPATISKDETAQLTFEVDNAQQVDQVVPPSLKDFDIISGPNQQSSMQITNGVMKQSIGVSYIIKPKAPGTFTIGEASANVNGKPVRSNKVTLKVTNTSSPNNNNNNSSPNNNKKNDNNNPATNQNFTFVSPLSNMKV